MKPIAFFGILVAVSLIGCSSKPNSDSKPDSEAILGEWMPSHTEEDGEVVDPKEASTIHYIFSSGKLTITQNGKTQIEGTFTLDPTRSPKEITFTLEDEVSHNIYRLEGDTMTICGPAFATRSDRPPTEFKSPKGSGLLLLRLERIKK